MSAPDNGGSAFPQMAKCGDIAVSEGGMTLRDYFAAKAMAACITDLREDPINYKLLSLVSYEMADAMLKARK